MPGQPNVWDPKGSAPCHVANQPQVTLANAGSAYTSAEQNLINDLKTKLNACLTALKSAGLMAQD